MKKEQTKMVSIKVKLLGITLPVVVIIMTFLVGFLYFISKNIITDYSQNLLRSSIESQADQIEAWLNENLEAFRMVKQSIEQTKPEQQMLQEILNSYYGFNDNYPDGLYIADVNGNLITASESEKSEADPLQSVWYKEGVTRWNMGYTQAYTNSKGEEVISVSGILDDQSGVIKVISADLTLERISIIVNSYIGMEHAQAFLVNNSDRKIIAHQDNSLISTKLSESSDAFMGGVDKKIEQQDFKMVEINDNMTAFEQIPDTDWILVSYIPVDVIYADIENVRTWMFVIGLVCIILLAIMLERVVQYVIHPVKGLTKAIIAMTEGDFTIQVKSKHNDEIGVMSRHVEQFILSMRQMIASICEMSDKLNVQAGDSNALSRQMYDSSQTQSNTMKELNTTVEQLSHSASSISNNATTLTAVVSDTRENGIQVDDGMQQTVNASQNGKAELQRVGDAMNTIDESVRELQHVIGEVGNASQEIVNVMEIIGNIADQTALLSLNTSIEAARAGDVGKGFGVVAVEISHLANTSTDAVYNIKKLIDEINSLVNDTIKQTNESVENINQSSNLVGNVLTTFDVIFDNIDKVSGLVNKMIVKVEEVDNVATNVAAISEEQASGTEKILATSETMVEQFYSITSNSESMSKGAEELKLSAQELYEQVARFKI